MCEVSGDEERRHLAFRDWLRAHPEDRDAYSELKHRLARNVDESDPVTLVRYTESKGDFVRVIERRALKDVPV